jgi:hypothetical protein
MTETENMRQLDLGRSWTSGHYQVGELPSSISSMKWSYGSLNQNQEKDFIFRRLQALDGSAISLSLHISLTEMISVSQNAMRLFAERDIIRSLRRLNKYSDEEIALEARVRSLSVVSLRDIQRVFWLFAFFLKYPLFSGASKSTGQQRSAMLLSMAVVYFMRLDNDSRNKYLQRLESLPGEQRQTQRMLDVLEEALDHVVANSNIKKGIARTRALKENIFMVLVCSLSKTPLMIVGPPGCSKVSNEPELELMLQYVSQQSLSQSRLCL